MRKPKREGDLRCDFLLVHEVVNYLGVVLNFYLVS